MEFVTKDLYDLKVTFDQKSDKTLQDYGEMLQLVRAKREEVARLLNNSIIWLTDKERCCLVAMAHARTTLEVDRNAAWTPPTPLKAVKEWLSKCGAKKMHGERPRARAVDGYGWDEIDGAGERGETEPTS